MESLLIISVLLNVILILVLLWRSPEAKMKMTFYFDKIQISGYDMKIRVQKGYTQRISAVPVDADGEPSKIEKGTAEFDSSDTFVAEVVEDPDDEQFALVVAKSSGTAEGHVKGDSDLNEGADNIKEVSTSFEIEVYDPLAVGFEVKTEGEPFKTPAEAPADVAGG